MAQAAQIKVSDIPRKGAALAKSKELTVSSLEYRELRNLALVDLLFATGIRVGEASALNIDDFDITELVFRVKGKGGRNRLAYVSRYSNGPYSIAISTSSLEDRC